MQLWPSAPGQRSIESPGRGRLRFGTWRRPGRGKRRLRSNCGYLAQKPRVCNRQIYTKSL